MDKATSTERAARVRRFLSRTLVVLGGAVAGTAVAWAVSGTAASAEPGLPVLEPAPVAEVFQPVTEPIKGAELINGAAAELHAQANGYDTKPTPAPQHLQQLLGDTFDAVLAEAPVPPQRIDEFGREVLGQVTDQLGLRTAEQQPTAIATRLLDRADDRTEFAAEPQQAPLPQIALAEILGAGQQATNPFSGRQSPSEVNHRGPPNDGSPSLPLLPSLPLPLAPPTAPTGACASCGHGSNDDAGMPVAHTWPDAHSGMATSRELRLNSQHVATSPGAQPGVTPD